MSSTLTMSLVFLISFLFTRVVEVQGFLPSRSSSQFRPTLEFSKGLFSPPRLTLASSDDDNDKEDEIVNTGPEKSRMKDYIAQYLGRNKPPGDDDNDTDNDDDVDDGFCSEDITTSTHLVAIPMDNCHELLIELESVQRAVLYHCPILLDACIPPAMTRLPLLYVQAKHQNSERVTSILADTVKQLIQKQLLSIETTEEVSEEDEEYADGVPPLTMTFQSLEIDGSNNNVLNTVGLANDEGTNKLTDFVCELQKAVEAKGWKTAFPPDPNESSAKDSVGGFRPRIPFMELPKTFSDNLNFFKDENTEIMEKDVEFLTSDQGGNGISPIFWCQWWDDVFGRNIRMREVGIYPRQSDDAGEDLSYSMFYLPYETIPLPDGNAAMLQTEKKFEKYQDTRLEEEQERMYQEQDGKDYNDRPTSRTDEPDILMTKTRERLENLYVNSAGDAATMEDIVEQDVPELPNSQSSPTEEKVNLTEEEKDESLDLDLYQPTASPDDYIEDSMKQRIKNVVESRESIKSRIPVKKEMPSIEDNPIFKAYKEGTLVPKEQPRKGTEKELGPYPGRDHFIGIWRVVTSPTGFPAEESTDETSENLILRVDGTTAGGPILDKETRQKAAGGTWKMIVEENGDVRLRIRLVIPPKKERILVMEGVVNRMNMNSDIPMASKNFGIPHLEAMAKEANKDKVDLMHCGGEVFMEDAITKKSQEQIGTFSLMKLEGPKDKGQYTFTIPKPIRNQD